MKLYSLYFSPTGGTEKVSRLITCAWDCEINEINLITEAHKLYNIVFKPEDVVFISVPSFSGRIPCIVADMLKIIKGNKALGVLTAVYGNRAYEDTLIELKDCMETSDFICIAAVAANAEHSIMHQYGAGRPDSMDITELKEFSSKIKAAISSHTYGNSVKVPGNRPYREVGKGSLKPAAAEKCIGCGKCSAECPIGAIPSNAPSETDTDKCIGCMHCISVCPVKARSLNKEVLNAVALKMQPLSAIRKPNELFI